MRFQPRSAAAQNSGRKPAAGVEALAGFVALLPAEATTTPPDESGALNGLTPADRDVVLEGMGLEAAPDLPGAEKFNFLQKLNF